MNTDDPEPSADATAARADAVRAFLTELSKSFEREFIVIGGWAVCAYGAGDYSLDGEAMISYGAQGTLRDSYEVTRNARTHKERFRGPMGDDVGLYVERRHRLPVPFAELQAHCRLQAGMWVACPEHLLVLKLAAWRERGHPPKGRKDQRDIINLLDRARGHFQNRELLAEHLSERDWQDLRAVCADPKTTDVLRTGNPWQGRASRAESAAILGGMQQGEPPAPAVREWRRADTETAMIAHRCHRPAATVTLAELCREAGFPCPVQTDWPLRVERLAAGPGEPTADARTSTTTISPAEAIHVSDRGCRRGEYARLRGARMAGVGGSARTAPSRRAAPLRFADLKHPGGWRCGEDRRAGAKSDAP